MTVSERDDEIASALPENLDALPRREGFRLRGLAPTRLETFIDAAFAFAITLLVIVNGELPHNIAGLLSAFRNVPVFIASVLVLGIFWRGHWLWSRRFGLEDGVSTLISWGLILTILIYVYPLRTVFGAMCFALSNGHFGSPLGAQSYAQLRDLFAVYAIGFSAISLMILLLNVRGWQLRKALRLNDRERMLTRFEIAGWSVPFLVGLVSFALATFLPERRVEWSGWSYFSLAILIPIYRRSSRAFLRRRLGQGEPALQQ